MAIVSDETENIALERAPSPESQVVEATISRHFPEGIAWGPAVWIAVIHLGAIAAPWTFTWQGLVTLFVLYWLTGGIGICLGFHRLLSHRSFQTYKPLRWFIAWIGGLAGEGSAIHWWPIIVSTTLAAITQAILTRLVKVSSGVTCFGAFRE